MKKTLLLFLISINITSQSIFSGFISDEIDIGDLPNTFILEYTKSPLSLKKVIRKLCLCLHNARNGIAYRDYARKEEKYGKEENHDLLLDISLVAKENGHQNDIDNAAEYFAQIPNPETDYIPWSKDYAADYKESALIIRDVADELDWDPEETKTAIKEFWTVQRKLQKSRKDNKKSMILTN